MGGCAVAAHPGKTPGPLSGPGHVQHARQPGNDVCVTTTPTSRVGVLFRATHESDLVGLAKDVEARSFDALALGEHTHIPVASNEANFPGGDGGIPRSYARLLDPYIALSWVAATTSLKVATSTSLPAEHDPIALAKAAATLDHLSAG